MEYKTKNLYFDQVFRRENVIMKALHDFFFAIASFPRLLIEVFLRKDFGCRYYSFASAMTVAVILLAWPVAICQGFALNSEPAETAIGRMMRPTFFSHYFVWYLYTAAFIFFSWCRKKEIDRNPSTFDFGHFSLSTGTIHGFFHNLRFRGKSLSPRTIQIWVEPALFFALGVILFLGRQNIGIVIMVAAICYSFSYAAAYKKGDDFVLDTIDEMIVNEEKEDAFVNDEEPENTRGVRFYTRKPKDKELRAKVAEKFEEAPQTAFVL